MTEKIQCSNLQKTVSLLVDAVNNHYDVDRVLADYGIRVLGTGNYTSDIPGYPDTYTGEFGDAYLLSVNVDSQAPYDTYIWTRNGDGGIWLNIGSLSIVGPQGPQGPVGQQGEPGVSSKWYVGTISPAISVASPKEGDCYLNVSTGNIEYYESAMWVYKGNIMGPSGTNGTPGLTPYIQDDYWYIGGNNTGVRAIGRDGATGTPGPAIDIVGKLTSVDVLPSPTEEIRHQGYIITNGTENRLYFVAGQSDALYWDYIIFDGNGTVVTTDGVGQTTWETNTKLDKINQQSIVYGTTDTGVQTSIGYSTVPTLGKLATYGTSGRLKAAYPEGSEDCTPKQYVDDSLSFKLDKLTTPYAVYATTSTGEQTYYQYAYGPTMSSAIPLYSGNKTLRTAEPVEDKDCATKKYVDDTIPQYYTKVMRLNSPASAPYVLNIDQLPNRTGGTPVHITYIQGSHPGLPGNEIALGNTTIANTNEYEGVPYLSNNNSQQSFTVNLSSSGDFFFVNKRDEYGIITGTTITFGMINTLTTNNQTVIVSYTAYR